MPKTVGVAVSNATFHFDKLYTYAVMPDQQDTVRLGSMVLVPFGRGSKARMGVVLAADGYPNNVIKGAAIPQIPVDESSHVYYAGVSSTEHGGLMASSGRVLLVEATADALKAAQDKVYAIIDKLDTSGMFYRHDIGAKALKA